MHRRRRWPRCSAPTTPRRGGRCRRTEASLALRPGAPDGRTPRLPDFVRGLSTKRTARRRWPHRSGRDRQCRASGSRRSTGPASPAATPATSTWSTGGAPWSRRPRAAAGCRVRRSIPALGFPLGSRLQMCWLEEGLPASLVPGRRPRTTLSPTLVYRDGQPVIACGTPGGDQQDQWQLVLLLSHLVRGLPLQEAIEAPSWHSNAMPSSFHPASIAPGRAGGRRSGLGGAIVDALRRRGHRVVVAGDWSLGRLSAVSRDPAYRAAAGRGRPPGSAGVRRRPVAPLTPPAATHPAPRRARLGARAARGSSH